MIVHANLDAEARWSGLGLPAAVATRISWYGALVAALAPAGAAVELWTPRRIDAGRLALDRPLVLRTGTPPRADLAWADPAARAANDRRLALAVCALPGARAIHAVDEVDLAGPWVAKVPWTAAGRDRCRGEGPPTLEQRARLGRLLARCGALVLEPWCERLVDAGMCGWLAADGTLTPYPAHALRCDARGGFTGIDLAAPALAPGELAQLERALAAAATALAAQGYAGPFAIDAFAYRDAAGARQFHPLCEINARYTFGWVARALGGTTLGFGPPPPAARVWIAPAADGITAWTA